MLGMKSVKSAVVSTVLVKFNVVSAPAAEVRLRAMAVAETFCGSVRSRLMTWMVPPEKGIEAFTTEEFWSNPEKKVTLPPATRASTRWPPVTLA